MKLKIMAIAATVMASFSINVTKAQAVGSLSVIDNGAVINNKIQAKFKKAFPGAEHTTWTVIKNGYEASFSHNGIETAVGYNKGGRLDYFVERYGANELPNNIKAEINDAYKEYDIMNAIAVHSYGETSYLVNIESKKFKKVIRIDNDGMDVYQDMAISF
jgi:hypothetical protein